MPATPTMAMPSRRLRGRRLPSIREKPMAAMDAANNSNRAKVVRRWSRLLLVGFGLGL